MVSKQMKVYVCKIKLLGMPFITASKIKAEEWANEDDTHYFDEYELEDYNA